MPDPRAVLERKIEGIDVEPFTLESFHTRRERKRRNQRLAAGALGLTIAVAGALIVARAALDPGATGHDVGTSPSPHPSPETTDRFESRLYGYSLSYPRAWTVHPAAAPWTSGGLNSGLADRFVDTVGPNRIVLEIGSIRLPAGMTAQEWMDLEQRRHARLVGFGTSCKRELRVLPTEVDGVPGRFVDCALVTVVTERRGYVIRLYEDVAIQLDLRWVLQSIELHPEDA